MLDATNRCDGKDCGARLPRLSPDSGSRRPPQGTRRTRRLLVGVRTGGPMTDTLRNLDEAIQAHIAAAFEGAIVDSSTTTRRRTTASSPPRFSPSMWMRGWYGWGR